MEIIMRKKQKPTETQNTWVKNGHVPGSHYGPMEHTTMDKDQYAKAEKPAPIEAVPFECHYQPRNQPAQKHTQLPCVRLFASSAEHACALTEKMLGKKCVKAIPAAAR